MSRQPQYSNFLQDLFDRAKPEAKSQFFPQFAMQNDLLPQSNFSNMAQSPFGPASGSPSSSRPGTLLGGLVNGVPEADKWQTAFMKRGPSAIQARGTRLDPSNDTFLTRMIWALRNLGQTPIL